jgi:hypothetical protein
MNISCDGTPGTLWEPYMMQRQTHAQVLYSLLPCPAPMVRQMTIKTNACCCCQLLCGFFAVALMGTAVAGGAV